MEYESSPEIGKVQEEYKVLVNRFHWLIDSGGSFEQVKLIYNDLKVLRSMIEYLIITENEKNDKHDTDADVGDAIPVQEK